MVPRSCLSWITYRISHDRKQLATLGIYRPVKKHQRVFIQNETCALPISRYYIDEMHLLCENLAVSACLVEHIHEVRVFKDVLHLTAAQKVFDILGDTCRNTAPFSESLPDFHRIGGGLLLLQKQVHLVDVVAG